MTKEEFLKKYEENYDEKMYRFRSSEDTRRKQTYTNNVLAKIVGKIETADLDMCYQLENNEIQNLLSYDFKDKLDKIKEKYDFLEFEIIETQVLYGDILSVTWKVKEEETCYD
jgi:hypothetical protein